jgi:hypothetical protein
MVTWVRLADDRLVRGDRVVAVDLWGPPAGEKRTDPVPGEPARIMLQVDGEAGEWHEAGTCSAEHGGELVTYLVNLLSSPGDDSDGPRYVYGVYERGELRRWMHGGTIVGREGVRPLHALPDPAPGSGLAALAGSSANRLPAGGVIQR